VRAHQLQPFGEEQLRSRQRGQPGPGRGQHLQRARHTVHCHQRHRAGGQQRDEAQPDLGDDRQGALAAGEQLRQVVPRVVLGQADQPAHHAAVRQDGLDPGELLAHAAVAHHPQAARVGRDQTADGGRGTRREVDADVQAVRAGVLLQLLQSHAGARGDLALQHVDVLDAGEPAQAEQHLAAGRDRRTDEAGVAALHGDRDARLGARPDDRGHLVGRGRAHHAPGLTGEPPGPVRLVRRPQVRIHQHVLRADDLPEAVLQIAHDSTRRRTVCSIARSWSSTSSVKPPPMSVIR
jgi:hypothetical protein